MYWTVIKLHNRETIISNKVNKLHSHLNIITLIHKIKKLNHESYKMETVANTLNDKEYWRVITVKDKIDELCKSTKLVPRLSSL